MKWYQKVTQWVKQKADAVAAKCKSALVKTSIAVSVGASTAVASVQAHAAGIDLTAITGAVSATDIATGVLAIGATMAVAYMTIKATKIVLNVLKSS